MRMDNQQEPKPRQEVSEEARKGLRNAAIYRQEDEFLTLGRYSQDLYTARRSWAERILDLADRKADKILENTDDLRWRVSWINHFLKSLADPKNPPGELKIRERGTHVRRLQCSIKQDGHERVLHGNDQAKVRNLLPRNTLKADAITRAFISYQLRLLIQAIRDAEQSMRWPNAAYITDDPKMDTHTRVRLYLDRLRRHVDDWYKLHSEIDHAALTFNSIEPKKTFRSFLALARDPDVANKQGPFYNALPRIVYITRNQPPQIFTEPVVRKEIGFPVLTSSLISRHRKGRYSRLLLASEKELSAAVRPLYVQLTQFSELEKYV